MTFPLISAAGTAQTSIPNYATMNQSSSSASAKAEKVFDQKVDQNQLKTQADSLYEEYSKLVENEKYYSAYQKLLSALELYEQCPEGRIKTRDLIWTYRELVWVSTMIRWERRKIGQECAWNTVLSGLTLCLGSPCGIYSCCKYGFTKWVDDETTSSYVTKVQDLANGFIQQLSLEHRIQMGTDKNSVPDEARKDLGYTYNQLGRLDLNDDSFTYTCCDSCAGSPPVITAAKARALANYKLAMEWDPSNITYSTNFNALDAQMKTPIVHVTKYYNVH